MSDISIPGVSSKYNSQKLVEDLMKVERIPLERMEERKENFETQKETWQDFSRLYSKVRDSAKKLYGYENPFNERIASSSDESILTATASREAVEEERDIKVLQTAKADRFLSASVSQDYEVPSGTYDFTLGDEEISIRFRGGSLKKFASTITSRSGGLLRSTVVEDTSDTQVILIESTKTGSSNRLEFKENSAELAEEIGMLKRNLTGTRDIQPQIKENQAAKGKTEQRVDGVFAGPQSRAVIPFSPPVKKEAGFFIEFEVTVTELPEDSYTPPEAPPGPGAAARASVTLEDITIFNEASTPSLPDWTPPPPPERLDDMNILRFGIGGTEVALNALKNGTQTIKIPLDSLSGNIDELIIDNKNTHREITVSPIKIYNPDQRGEYSAANPIDSAMDAVIEVDGIKVIRESNDIDDVIQGVTLHLQNTGDKKVELNIQPNRELIKEKIIEFVGTYNQLMTEINILTARDSKVIDEITYFSDDEREKAEKRMGLFQGDNTLRQVKSRLQTIMMNPYETSLGNELSLLAQAGISTNSTGAGDGLEATRLRGYLEINEQKLDQVMADNMTALKELFGRDSDSDLIVDMGAGHAIDQYITPFTQTGGILAFKTSSLDRQIDRTDREISTFNEKLERIEQDLRRKYGMMEGMIENLQKSSSALNNLNNSNGNK